MPTAGKKTEQLSELLDLFPTFCELAEIETPDFADGKSLVPILKDASADVHQGAVSQYFRKLNGKSFMGYSIRTPTHRLVEWRDFKSGEVTDLELYDHQQDPGEQKNMADSAPEVVQQIT